MIAGAGTSNFTFPSLWLLYYPIIKYKTHRFDDSYFAVHHLLGYLVIPELVFGTTSYSLTICSYMPILIFTSATTSWQIISTLKIETLLKRAMNSGIIEEITSKLSQTSIQLNDTALR